MLRRKLLKQFTWCKFRRRSLSTENHVKHSEKNEVDLSRVRNIGILAHIDAGKTTTTERMLFYSGTIGNMGEVHHGNTVTDYMDQERQRGITITSAAVTFGWKNHRFNLIDTPGHIDFTMEVEQTLNVMDGAVVVLDGSAGVEAQTLTVWRQADRYALPRIIYVNKMDRLDANFNYCISSVESKLETTALPAQIPIQDSSGLTGIVDVLTMQLLTFEKKNEGKKYQRVELTEEKDGSIWERAMEARSKLTDKLSGVDDRLAELVIEQESLDKIPAQILVESMRRCTIAGKGVPLLLGSSYKNAGVQPLMDGVILYLPSPASNSSAKQFHCFGDNLAARAFKVVHDKHKGALTFLRIYSGTFKQGQRVFNVQKENTEQCGKLFEAYADEYSEVAAIERGNIAAVSGLKLTTSGDLLTTSATAASQAKRAMQKQNNTTNEDVESLFGTGARVPNPVFFCSIEPPSISYQVPLDTALEQLQREDPSLRVTQDAETGQTVLSGMGELHLEIIAERIRSEFKIDVDLGPLQIAYKETLQTAVKDTHVTSHRIGSTTHSVQTTMSIEPNYKGEDVLRLDRTPDSVAHTNAISPRILQLAKKGVNAALNNGPKLGCPVINVGVTLHWLEIGKGTSTTMISATITQCLHKLLRTGGTMLLEPIMQLEVVTSEETVSLVISDLSRRRAQIQQIGSRGRSKIVYALTPLSELLGYSKSLRTLTSGAGSFSIEFNHYQEMGALEERQAIERVTGFAH